MTALVVDLSSNNPAPDLDAHWRAGRRHLILKVTEGTSYVWPGHDALADHWHRLGGYVGHYHFLTPGSVASGQAQGRAFWSHTARHYGPHDRVICDVETNGESDGEVGGFVATVRGLTSLPGLVYGSPYFLRDNGIHGHGWGLWLADYAAKIAFLPPGWTHWDLWQFTDRAPSVPGISGAVDESYVGSSWAFAAPTPTLPAWYKRVLAYPAPAHPGVTKNVRLPGGRVVPMQFGDDVRTVQHKVGATVDGIYGPGTAGNVAGKQHALGIQADGAVGPITAGRMGP